MIDKTQNSSSFKPGNKNSSQEKKKFDSGKKKKTEKNSDFVKLKNNHVYDIWNFAIKKNHRISEFLSGRTCLKNISVYDFKKLEITKGKTHS